MVGDGALGLYAARREVFLRPVASVPGAPSRQRAGLPAQVGPPEAVQEVAA
jgi:hypothetical protein